MADWPSGAARRRIANSVWLGDVQVMQISMWLVEIIPHTFGYQEISQGIPIQILFCLRAGLTECEKVQKGTIRTCKKKIVTCQALLQPTSCKEDDDHHNVW